MNKKARSLFEEVISGDYFTEAKELCSGIFWVIADNRELTDWKLIVFDIPCDTDGNQVGEVEIPLNAKSGGTYNHRKIWDTQIKGNPSHRPYNREDYDYYPRGRVMIANNRATVYLNPNVNVDSVVSEVRLKFGLSDHNVPEVRVVNDGSVHYRCWMDRED